VDAELLKLLITVSTFVGSATGLAMRVGSLRAAIEAQLSGLSKQMDEIRGEMKEIRDETRTLTRTQNDERVEIGRLQASFAALKEHVDKALQSQREDLERVKSSTDARRGAS
jgi:chromosome segregation ATPase